MRSLGLTIVAHQGDVSAEIDRFVVERGVVLPPSYRNRTPVPATTCSH
jgi:hypothetical protein